METNLIKKRDGSPNWHLNFTVEGLRFRKSLGTPDEKIANTIAAKFYSDALLGKFKDEKPEITLDAACTRYWEERMKGLPSADMYRRRALALLEFFGKDKLLSEITEAELVTYATSRRVGQKRHRSGKVLPSTRAPHTINCELMLVNTLCRRARRLWKANAPEISIKDVLLVEPDHRQHLLTADEEDRLFEVLRPDMHGMVRFALITGVRIGNIVTLRWNQVHWEERQIEFRVKSKMPGGKVMFVPITNTIAAILSAERGRHPEFVFTFICLHANTFPDGSRHLRGQRYPYKARHGGWRDSWQAALKAIGLRHGKFDRRNFRFHDLRHTAATRTLRATRNLSVVKELLGHEDIATTMRYAHLDIEDVREAHDAVEKMMASRRGLRLIKTKKAE